MNNPEQPFEPATVTIDGKPFGKICGVKLDSRSLGISLRPYEVIDLYAFNSFMLPIKAKRSGIEQYVLDGPQLGIYL